MNLYDVMDLEKEIDSLAYENDGEIPEEKMQELIVAQTNALDSMEKLLKYVKHLDRFQEAAKTEEERIYKLRKQAENRVSSIKRYIAPYVHEKGKFDLGTFKLSPFTSESVEVYNDLVLDEEFIDTKTTRTPNKTRIKEAIKAGREVIGAKIVENVSVKIR